MNEKSTTVRTKVRVEQRLPQQLIIIQLFNLKL